MCKAWIAGWANWLGSGANSRDLPRVGLLTGRSHADLSPSAATYLAGRIVGTVAGHHLVGARATFVCECATVLTAGRPHADVWRQMWDCFRDIGDEAHIDLVTKCKAHLSKAEQAKLDEADRFATAGNERADELAKEGARDDSFQCILCDTYKGAVETCKAIIGYIGCFILRAKGGERWLDVVAPPPGGDEKDERWKRAKPVLGASSCLEAQRTTLALRSV